METTIVIDAGHGGADPGAVYEGRQEKDDALRLALAVGSILEDNGINVVYTRTTDEYETPFKKATDANQAGADYFISFHRNSSVRPENFNGFETLLFNDAGVKATMARNINENMEEIGFKNNGVTERPNLVVLKRTQMPALLLEVGFINNTQDNQLFDERFNAIARGIADGILDTISDTEMATKAMEGAQDTLPVITAEQPAMPYRPLMPPMGQQPFQWQQIIPDGRYPDNMVPSMPERKLYRVQVGAYKNRESADRLLNSLLSQGFPAFIVYDDELYKVQVGAYEMLANAVAMEERLRRFRYNTYITT